MPLPPYTRADLRRETIHVEYQDDPDHQGPNKTLETITLPSGYIWVKTGTRTRTRRVKNVDTLFDDSGNLVMSYFGEMINPSQSDAST